MLEFRIGDRVTFEPKDGTPVFGILTRYNTKSVTVITDDVIGETCLRASCVWLNQPSRQQKHKKAPIRAP
jgi:hypothetical protein